MSEDGRHEYYKYLVGIMLKTRGARFTSASSLVAKDRMSVATVAFLSVYMLGWSVVSLTYPEIFSADHSRFFNAVSIVASTALLAITLVDLSFGRSSRAEKLQANALEISEILRAMERLLAEPEPDFVRLAQIAAKYERYVTQTAINHSAMDFRKWKYGSAKGTNWFHSGLLGLRSIAFDCFYYLSSMFVYFALMASILGATIWYTTQVVFVSTIGPV